MHTYTFVGIVLVKTKHFENSGKKAKKLDNKYSSYDPKVMGLPYNAHE